MKRGQGQDPGGERHRTAARPVATGHAGTDSLGLTLHDEGFTVTDDGETPPEGRADDLFTYGEAAPDAASGMVLPVVETLARTHGCVVTPDPGYDGGVRYHVGGVTVERAMEITE